MKTRLFALFIYSAVCAVIYGQTNMMVFSDPHVFAPSLFDTTSASFRAYYASEPKLVEHSAELFDSAVARVLNLQPDILIIPGDLTKDGERASHEYVAAALSQIQNAGIQVFVVPGNHDISNPAAKAYTGATSTRTNSISNHEFDSIYANFGHTNAEMTFGHNYLCYPTPDLAIIGINSCKTNDSVRYSAGGIDDATLQWIEQAAEQADETGRTIIAIMHHEIMAHFDHHEEFAPTYIANQEEGYPQLNHVQQRLCNAGIQAIFTGHYHINSIQSITSERGTLYDISTGSTCSYPSPIRTLTLSNGTLSIDNSEITRYHSLEKSRNQNTARGGINTLARNFYPYVQDLQLLLSSMGYGKKYRFPANCNAFAADINSYMLTSFTEVINELSRGNEDLRVDPDSTLFHNCLQALDNYLYYFSYNNATRKTILEAFFYGESDLPALVRDIVRSILYNYVSVTEADFSITENHMPDGDTSVILRTITQPDLLDNTDTPTDISSLSSGHSSHHGVYSITGQFISSDESVLSLLPSGMYIANGRLSIVR